MNDVVFWNYDTRGMLLAASRPTRARGARPNERPRAAQGATAQAPSRERDREQERLRREREREGQRTAERERRERDREEVTLPPPPVAPFAPSCALLVNPKCLNERTRRSRGGW